MRFISFFKSNVKFGTKLKLGSTTASRSVIRRDTSCASSQLRGNRLGPWFVRQRVGDLKAAQGKFSRSRKKLAHFGRP